VDKGVVSSVVTISAFEEQHSEAVGRLIADTYGKFNLSFASPAERALLLGPFQHAYSAEKAHHEAIARALRSPIALVAEEDGEIVGVLRGRKERLGSLFVRGDRHRQGIGRMLVQRFEQECLGQGMGLIRVASSLYAVPFYLAMGYKRSTGVRFGWSFGGTGLKIQPMRKVLKKGGTN
jgi:GNAT superfamily N-acetyltransferase